jgi:hypothetical protein
MKTPNAAKPSPATTSILPTFSTPERVAALDPFGKNGTEPVADCRMSRHFGVRRQSAASTALCSGTLYAARRYFGITSEFAVRVWSSTGPRKRRLAGRSAAPKRCRATLATALHKGASGCDVLLKLLNPNIPEGDLAVVALE